MAFYILYKVYSNENFKVTPFEAIVLSSINKCLQVMETQPESYEAIERRAEYVLLSEFVISTPKMGGQNVNDFIQKIEQEFLEYQTNAQIQIHN